MNITYITDCTDDNVRGRMAAKIDGLLGEKTSFIGVKSDVEAAGNLIDILNVTNGAKGVIMVNVAPRDGVQHKWENGTPFGYLWYKETLLIASVDGYALSLLKKFGIAESINIIEIKDALPTITASGMITPAQELAIRGTQFRSLDYVPLAARYLMEHKSLPHVVYPFTEVADMPPAVWWLDNFGNAKTTYTTKEVDFVDGQNLTTALGQYAAHKSLRDVPDGALSYTIGSSGFGDVHFIELVAQGVNSGSARDALKLQTGIVKNEHGS